MDKLPAKVKQSNPVIQKANQLRTENRAELVNLETFTKALNRKPAVVKTNKFQNGAKYVPISHVQMLLDQMFFGAWQTRNFRYQVVGNELVGSVELWLWHPVTKEWMVRTGVAATQIRQHKGAALTDFNQKIKNALEMDAPHLYADCIKSAAKTLGAAFGRDLNRDFQDNYKALVSKHVQAGAYTAKEVQENVSKIETGYDLSEYWESNDYWKTDAEIKSIFEERKRELMNDGF